MRKHTLLLSFVLVLLAGCAHDPNPQAKTSQSLALAPGGTFGAVVASIGHESATPFAASHVVFRRSDGPGGGLFIYQPRYMVPSPKDFETTADSGTVTATKLPPGEYMIGAIGAMWHAGLTRFTPSMQLSEPISFTVKPGTITYLGRYVLGTQSRNPTAPPALRIENAAEQDMKVALDRNPELTTLKAETFVVPLGRRER